MDVLIEPGTDRCACLQHRTGVLPRGPRRDTDPNDLSRRSVVSDSRRYPRSAVVLSGVVIGGGGKGPEHEDGVVVVRCEGGDGVCGRGE